MKDVSETFSTVFAGIIGLATIAVILSRRATTQNVIGSFSGGLSNLIAVSISPLWSKGIGSQTIAPATFGGLGGSTATPMNTTPQVAPNANPGGHDILDGNGNVVGWSAN
jgi:PRD1 phage membrane DNA delivery